MQSIWWRVLSALLKKLRELEREHMRECDRIRQKARRDRQAHADKMVESVLSKF